MNTAPQKYPKQELKRLMWWALLAFIGGFVGFTAVYFLFFA